MAFPLLGATTALQGVGNLVNGLTNWIPTRQSTRNRSKVDDLLRREELGILGLSAAEEQELANRLQSQAEASRRVDQRNQEMALSSFGMGGAGAQLAQAIAAQEAAASTQSQIGGAVAAMDERAKQEQRQELEDRLAAEAERQQQIIGGITGGISSAAEFGAEALNVANLTEGLSRQKKEAPFVNKLQKDLEDPTFAGLYNIAF